MAAVLESLATRCAERGYITDRLVLTGSGSDAKDTWRVELVTTEDHRARAETFRVSVPKVAEPERRVESEAHRLLPNAVRDFCRLRGREESPTGLDAARTELSKILSTARYAREQENGFQLWKAVGRGAAHGKPRWRFLVREGRVRRVLPEHDRAAVDNRARGPKLSK